MLSDIMDVGINTRLAKADPKEPRISRLCEVLEKGGLKVSDSALALCKKVGRR